MWEFREGCTLKKLYHTGSYGGRHDRWQMERPSKMSAAWRGDVFSKLQLYTTLCMCLFSVVGLPLLAIYLYAAWWSLLTQKYKFNLYGDYNLQNIKQTWKLINYMYSFSVVAMGTDFCPNKITVHVTSNIIKYKEGSLSWHVHIKIHKYATYKVLWDVQYFLLEYKRIEFKIMWI